MADSGGVDSALDAPISPWALTAKRAVDLSLGVVLAIVSAVPLLLLALIVRLESPGPAFTATLVAGVQRRRPRRGVAPEGDESSSSRGEHRGRRVHDAGGRLFGLVSFRVHEVGADGRVAEAPDGVARLTRLGAWLRATGLEHWPNILHLLTGELTLVGPRALSPRWAVRLNEEVPLYAAAMLGVVPGWIGPSRRAVPRGRAAGAEDPLMGVLVERVLRDLPYALALRSARGALGALALDIATLRRGLAARAGARLPVGNEVVVLEHPLRFAQLPVDANELAARRPGGMAAEVHEHDGLLTTWWYPARADAPGLPGRHGHPSEVFTAAWCERRHVFDPAELVLTKQLQPAPGEADLLRVELPCTLVGLGAVCAPLMPLWASLQWRSPSEKLGLKQSLVLLEGAARLAALPGDPSDRIEVSVEVDGEAARLRLRRRPRAVTAAAGPGSPLPRPTFEPALDAGLRTPA